MIPEDFLKRVALTLEVSMRMVKDWLLELHPENLEQKNKIEDHINTINGLLVEIAEFTREAHSSYQLGKIQDKALDAMENAQEDLNES